jgi:hypothetical protein
MADIPDALDVAVATTDLGMARPPAWWRVIGAVQWVAVLAALAGLVWLGVRYALFLLALPELATPSAGGIPVPTALLGGGLLGGLLLALLVRPVVRVAARRRRRRAEVRLRAAVARVTDDLVLEPFRTVLRAYADARAALRDARNPA